MSRFARRERLFFGRWFIRNLRWFLQVRCEDVWRLRRSFFRILKWNFGEFENRNYLELTDNPHYQEWVDSNGTLPFPGGESREQCRDRNLCGFHRVLTKCLETGIHEAAMVVHGGTIMNVLEAYGEPARRFYEWHVGNGRGYLVETEPADWKDSTGRLKVLKTL